LGGGDGAMTMHAIEHPISGFYDIAHGDGLAALLPMWLRSLEDVCGERLRQLRKNIFMGQDAIAFIEKWLCTCSMNYKLRDLGVDKAKLLQLGQNALDTAPWLAMHPKILDSESIASIYESAW
jgi:alcohol dehydrogenase class IV